MVGKKSFIPLDGLANQEVKIEFKNYKYFITIIKKVIYYLSNNIVPNYNI